MIAGKTQLASCEPLRPTHEPRTKELRGCAIRGLVKAPDALTGSPKPLVCDLVSWTGASYQADCCMLRN